MHHQDKDYVITRVEECAFANNEGIESLSFADDSSVQTIGGSAFMESSIKSLILPKSITDIVADLTYLARNLVNLQIPELPNYKYVNNTYLLGKNDSNGEFDALRFVRRDFSGKFVVPSGIKSINNSAFCSCKNLTAIEFQSPCCVERFDMNAFLECSGLTNLDIPASVTVVDDRCFMDAVSLDSVNFLGQNVTIGDSCFYQCYQLKKVAFPNGKTVKIGIDAFHDHHDDFKVDSPPGVDIEYKKNPYDYSD